MSSMRATHRRLERLVERIADDDLSEFRFARQPRAQVERIPDKADMRARESMQRQQAVQCISPTILRWQKVSSTTSNWARAT